MKKILLSLFLLISFTVKSQVVGSIRDTVILGWNVKYYVSDANYHTSGLDYPMLIFYPGFGEQGTNAANLLVYGPMRQINRHLTSAGSDTWDGTTNILGLQSKFIVCAVQKSGTGSYPTESEVENMQNALRTKFREDVNRIYYAGLSAGTCAFWRLVMSTDARAAVPAAAINMSFGPNDPYPTTDIRRWALAGGKSWMFEGTTDNRNMNVMRDTMNARVPGSARYTNYVGGHGGWNTYYATTYKETVSGTSMNVYEWLSLQTKAGNISPSAAAGSDQSTSGTSITFAGSGSDADGTIASILWTRISGPNTPTITTPSSYTSTVTGLITGTYVFRLTVTDDDGATNSDDMTVTVSAANVPPSVTAGIYKTVYLPTSTASIASSATDSDGTIASYLWTKISGPTATLSNTTTNTLSLSDLTEGEYQFKILVTDDDGATDADTTGLLVMPSGHVSIRQPGDTNNLNGINPGYYGSNWRDTGLYRIGYNAGARSTRSTIPMHFFTTVSEDGGRLMEFQFFYDLGYRENTVFLNNQTSTEYPDRDTTMYGAKRSKLPRGLYQPIWKKDGSIDTSNRFAFYCWKVASIYGDYIKYYEIWNEPDFTYSENAADAAPGVSNNWWDNDPSEQVLENLNAPIESYIRMLRIAWEVIHKYDPDGMVATGGLGYASFVNALLRNTDNPVDGSVTADYPLTAGAFFDAFSWHIYPHYYPNYYNAKTGQTNNRRHTDEMLNQTKFRYSNLVRQLSLGGFGTTYPLKPSILTEMNIPRKKIVNEFGSNEAQRNGAWKFLVFADKFNVKQSYWFQLADDQPISTASNVFAIMGLYTDISDGVLYGSETKTDLGIATTTWTSNMLGYLYDSVQTKAMQMPSGIDGAAYKNDLNEYKYVMWAVTATDSSEAVIRTYSFPPALALKTLTKVTFDNSSSTVQPLNVSLDGNPVILTPTSTDATAVLVGNPPVVTLPGTSYSGPGNDYLEITATATSPDGRPLKYFWEQIPPYGTGTNTFNKPAIKFVDSNFIQVNGFPAGRYVLRFTAIDDRGLYSSKDLIIRKTVTEQTIPVVTGAADQSIGGTSTTVTASATAAAGLASYKWVQLTGKPATITNGESSTATITVPESGAYQFRFYATDLNGARVEDDVSINVTLPTTPTIRFKKKLRITYQ